MSEKRSPPGGLSRRQVLRRGSGALAGAAALPVIGAATPTRVVAASPTADYPVTDVAPLADLSPGTTVAFSYPDADSPAMLLRLEAGAPGGAGEDATLVAYSTLCTHKGCPVLYKPEHNLLVCPCHWSTFDPAKGGGIVIGQASQALARIELRVDDGMVRAVGVRGQIYGRQTNVL